MSVSYARGNGTVLGTTVKLATDVLVQTLQLVQNLYPICLVHNTRVPDWDCRAVNLSAREDEM